MKIKNKKLVLGLLISLIIISLFSLSALYKNSLTNTAFKKDSIDLNGMFITASQVERKDIVIKTHEDYINTFSMFSNVKETLVSLGIDVDEDDKVLPGLYDKVTNDMVIEIIKVEKQTISEKSEIPYKVVKKYNENTDIGVTKIINNGVSGLRCATKEVVYENGKLVNETLIQEQVIKEPVNKVIETGTKDYFISSRGKTSFKSSLVMTASAYDLSFESCGKRPGDKYYGITASGTKARPGVVAVDPSVIPLGTKLYIKGYGFAIAEDKGGAIKGNRIDLFMENRNDALNYGMQKAKVYILE